MRTHTLLRKGCVIGIILLFVGVASTAASVHNTKEATLTDTSRNTRLDHPNQDPIANFTWWPPVTLPGETFLFNASASYDPDGYITLYAWDWNNDGVYDETHTTPTATHAWSSPGNYSVTLQVTDDTGLKGTTTKILAVVEGHVYLGGTMGKNGWYVSSVTITIECGFHVIYYKLHAGDPWTEWPNAPITFSVDGVYELYFYYVDQEGVPHYFGPYPFKIDKTPPVLNVTVTTNRLKTIWYITVSVSDATSGVAALSLYIDDALVGNITPPGPGFNYTFKWKGRGHTVQVVAYDVAGNYAKSSVITPCVQNANSPSAQSKSLLVFRGLIYNLLFHQRMKGLNQ